MSVYKNKNSYHVKCSIIAILCSYKAPLGKENGTGEEKEKPQKEGYANKIVISQKQNKTNTRKKKMKPTRHVCIGKREELRRKEEDATAPLRTSAVSKVFLWVQQR